MCASESPQKRAAAVELPASAEVLAARAAIQATPLAHVVSRSADGAARFLIGGADRDAAALPVSADAAARLHIAHNAQALGLNEAVVAHATVKGTQTLAGGGSVVQFEQQVDGVTVFRSRASVVLDASKNLVSLASTLNPAASSDLLAKKVSFRRSPESALSTAYTSRSGSPLAADAVRSVGTENGDWRAYKVATPVGALRIVQASVRRVLFPESKSLVAAHHVEFITRKPGSNVNEAYGYIVAADDGRVLNEELHTANEAFTYRVWADPNGTHTPADGPLADFTPHPTGKPDGIRAGYAAPILVTTAGFNKNPAGAVDPWLPATATKTTEGNNVQAYSDRDDTHAPADGSAPGSPNIGDGLDANDITADVNGGAASPRTFDRTYDVTKPPEGTEQIKASVTQIFYMTNWLHDFWYDSGFNEAAGNAQLSNLGRGGVEGDPVQAQAQDGADFGQKDNANMSQTPDGVSPVMQMFVWDGLANRKITTTPAIAFDDEISVPTNVPVTFTLGPVGAVLADDGTAPASDGCQVPTNVIGKIAVIDFDVATSKCKSVTRVDNAKAGKAVGVIFVDGTPGHAAGGYGGSAAANIPVFGISFEDGAKLKAALSPTFTATMFRGPEVQHDGTLDNSVVAHEWAHYLHHRLVDCGGKQCGGMSEGWADLDALMMVVKEGDRVGGTYALAQYDGQGSDKDSEYFGIRRSPYSTDMTKNALTFKCISDKTTLPTTAPIHVLPENSEVHNAGEVWAETMFEAYSNVLEAGKVASPVRSFDESKRRMADYVVAGMKATPVEATFTEQRDAVMATVWASGHKDDFAAMAKAFAKRGMGVGAASPVGNTNDTSQGEGATFDDAVENFDNKGAVGLAGITVDDSGPGSCDHDGILDSGETGTVTLKIKNTGWLPLSKTKAKVTSTNATVSFANKGLIDVPAIDPFGIATVTVAVTVGDPTPMKSALSINVNLNDADAVKPSVDVPFATLFNYDDKPASSATDDVESAKPIWTMDHGKGKPRDAWTRQGDTTNHFWHGDDTPSPADESLVSPDLKVAATGDFTISFGHTYKFEMDPGSASDAGAAVPTYFDGAVLEITSDGGTTWEDISKYADPGYTGKLTGSPTTSTNVLAGRSAYVGSLAGYPTLTNVKLNLKAQLAGKTVKLRFRIGTDDAAGVEGWNVDNISFGGITNTPFSTIVDNSKICVAPGAPDAGTDAGGTAGNGDTGGGGSSGGCSASPGMGHGTTGMAGAGLLGGLGLLFARRRRAKR
jgi:MYXO-CTERM domain-containing protein